MYYVYVILNLINNKVYVGQTNNLKLRWSQHKHDSKKNINYPIYNALNKYGIDNFLFQEVGCYDSLESVNEAEEYWIKSLSSNDPQLGYNIRSGGKVSLFTEESKLKMSLARRGIKLSDETKRKISEVQIGKTLSQETKNKISKALSGENAPWFGKTMPDSARENMSKAQSGKVLSQETKDKMSLARSGANSSFYGKEPQNKTIISLQDEQEIINDYINGKSLSYLKKKFKIGQDRIKQLFFKRNIEIRKVGRKCLK